MLDEIEEFINNLKARRKTGRKKSLLLSELTDIVKDMDLPRDFQKSMIIIFTACLKKEDQMQRLKLEAKKEHLLMSNGEMNMAKNRELGLPEDVVELVEECAECGDMDFVSRSGKEFKIDILTQLKRGDSYC